MVTQSLLLRALRAYARTLSVADPIRLQFWDDVGLTMPQLRLMFLLFIQDGRSVGELADEMHVRPATITGLTDRLVRHRLIERQDDPEDRRIVRVALTDKGRHVLGEIEAAGRAYLNVIFERMGEEAVEQLVEALERFCDIADAVQQAEAPL